MRCLERGIVMAKKNTSTFCQFVRSRFPSYLTLRCATCLYPNLSERFWYTSLFVSFVHTLYYFFFDDSKIVFWNFELIKTFKLHNWTNNEIVQVRIHRFKTLQPPRWSLEALRSGNTINVSIWLCDTFWFLLQRFEFISDDECYHSMELCRHILFIQIFALLIQPHSWRSRGFGICFYISNLFWRVSSQQSLLASWIRCLIRSFSFSRSSVIELTNKS